MSYPNKLSAPLFYLPGQTLNESVILRIRESVTEHMSVIRTLLPNPYKPVFFMYYTENRIILMLFSVPIYPL